MPQDYLYQTFPNEKIGTLVTNSRLSDRLLEKNLPKVSNLDVSIDNGKYNAKVRLYLPHDFNENRKYPLLVNVYAGPNSQQVNDRCLMININHFTYSRKWKEIHQNGSQVLK